MVLKKWILTNHTSEVPRFLLDVGNEGLVYTVHVQLFSLVLNRYKYIDIGDVQTYYTCY